MQTYRCMCMLKDSLFDLELHVKVAVAMLVAGNAVHRASVPGQPQNHSKHPGTGTRTSPIPWPRVQNSPRRHRSTSPYAVRQTTSGESAVKVRQLYAE